MLLMAIGRLNASLGDQSNLRARPQVNQPNRMLRNFVPNSRGSTETKVRLLNFPIGAARRLYQQATVIWQRMNESYSVWRKCSAAVVAPQHISFGKRLFSLAASNFAKVIGQINLGTVDFPSILFNRAIHLSQSCRRYSQRHYVAQSHCNVPRLHRNAFWRNLAQNPESSK